MPWSVIELAIDPKCAVDANLFDKTILIQSPALDYSVAVNYASGLFLHSS
jgi:hypothetical protein